MQQEIERKFIVLDDRWRLRAGPALAMRQGYLASFPTLSVRVRRAGGDAFLTVKGGTGLVRSEYQYAIPPSEADEMLDSLCSRPLVEKHRHAVPWSAAEWVVDVFLGDLAGLVLAEIELASPDQAVVLPPWAGREVTDDPRYVNANLAKFGKPDSAGG